VTIRRRHPGSAGAAIAEQVATRRGGGEDSRADTGWEDRVADDPRQTIQELRDLVVAYARQETLDPLKGMGRYIGLGIAGAVLIGSGIAFLAIGALRALQTETGDTFDDWMSFLPYLIVVVGLLILAGIAWMAGSRRKAKP
jgi:Putative Actinobacterial Holin-X, holin superfamily III